MKWAVLVLAVLGVAGVLWIAGESHYRGCVAAAEAATPIPVVTGGDSGGYGGFDPGAYPRAAASKQIRARRARVAGCSRLPF